MSSILGVGIATLDIINEVDGYPAEDSEVRALAQQQRRGGNATNTLVVLSQLGHRCAWAGVMADDAGSALIAAELARYHIDLSAVVNATNSTTPTSYIALNRRNGSRTIVHFRDLPELSAGQFETVALEDFDWVHFEARNIDDTLRMLMRVRAERPMLCCSLEVEKARPGVAKLFGLADVIMLARHYANASGFDTPQACLRKVQERAPQAQLFLGWGGAGAYASAPSGTILHCPARIPERVVDTIGAGDAFNAGIIDALLRGLTTEQALERATLLAGRKCAQSGFDGLGASGTDQR